MNHYLLGNIKQSNDQPLVNFNYNIQKNRNPRRSMFQIFSPKKNSKKVSNKTHVFHKDEMRGVWVPYFNLSNGSTQMSEDEFKSQAWPKTWQ